MPHINSVRVKCSVNIQENGIMTILRQADWKKFPSAIIDYNTSNKSALQLAAKLRVMGVENNAFFLALHNTKLVGVDPHSPNLTVSQMTDIGLEIRTNAWYFFREVARAPAISGIGTSPIEFNRANIALWWSFFNHITFILIQPRQTGKSFSTDLLNTILMGFKCNNTQINLLTKDEKLRGENIARLKKIYEELPVYLSLKTREDANNTEELSVKKLGNTYKTYVPQASQKRAINVGRGMTTPIFHIDEAPFQVNIRHSYPAAMGAMGAAITQAKREDEPYGIILTTTAGKTDDVDGAFVYRLVEESALWSERFYDAPTAEALETMVRRNSRGGVYQIYAAFSHLQLGKTDAWLRGELERLKSTPDDANRDFFNIWTSGSQSSPLAPQLLDRMNKSVMPSVHDSISSIGGYILRWYIHEEQIMQFMNTRKTIIGVDTSDATGGDDISVTITDVETGKSVAVGNFNETMLITFAEWLIWLLVNYTQATMIIERRSSAVTIIDYLLMLLPQRGIDPFKRLFNWIINDPHENPALYAEATAPMARRTEATYVKCKKYFGFATSGSGQTSRTELYSTTLQNAAKRCAEGILDKHLAQQISGLVTRNGRIDHDVGQHDDLVISWLLNHWFLAMAKNLSYYGIDPRTILVQTTEVKHLSDDDKFTESIQRGIRARIQELFELMSEESDFFVCGRYEQELKALDNRLVLVDGERFSLSSFLHEIKEKKKQSRGYSEYGTGRSHLEKLGYATNVDYARLGNNVQIR